MSVSDFMTNKVVTVHPETTIVEAIDLMKEHSIHRLPVMEKERLIGLITEGVIQEALPSKATSLSVYELNYLLNKTSVREVMIREVETIDPTALLEDAIAKMRTNNIGVLPVVCNDALIGIITNNDIFDAFLKITGYNDGGTRISLKIKEDRVGVIADIATILAAEELNIVTIVVNHIGTDAIVEIQVSSSEVLRIREVFEQSGYEVLAAVQTNNE